MMPSMDENPDDDLICLICEDDVQVHAAGEFVDEMLADLAFTHTDGTPLCI